MNLEDYFKRLQRLAEQQKEQKTKDQKNSSNSFNGLSLKDGPYWRHYEDVII